jgi:hypothetical protein
MPEILNLLAPLRLGGINRENLPKRVRNRATLTVASKKKKKKERKKKLFQKVGAVSLVCY